MRGQVIEPFVMGVTVGGRVLHWFDMTAAKETTLKEVGKMLTHVVTHMATKEDIGRVDDRLDEFKSQLKKVDTRLSSIESELRMIRRDLDDLREKFENVSGFRKEIDHVLERIAEIEKHLGLDEKIAA
jgi:predicted RNase H-like nuclease (RuvC/YqgF family)